MSVDYFDVSIRTISGDTIHRHDLWTKSEPTYNDLGTVFICKDVFDPSSMGYTLIKHYMVHSIHHITIQAVLKDGK